MGRGGSSGERREQWGEEGEEEEGGAVGRGGRKMNVTYIYIYWFTEHGLQPISDHSHSRRSILATPLAPPTVMFFLHQKKKLVCRAHNNCTRSPGLAWPVRTHI